MSAAEAAEWKAAERKANVQVSEVSPEDTAQAELEARALAAFKKLYGDPTTVQDYARIEEAMSRVKKNAEEAKERARKAAKDKEPDYSGCKTLKDFLTVEHDMKFPPKAPKHTKLYFFYLGDKVEGVSPSKAYEILKNVIGSVSPRQFYDECMKHKPGTEFSYKGITIYITKDANN